MQHVEDGGHFGLEAAGDGRRALRGRGGGRDGSDGGARAARIGERRQEERRDGAVAAQVRGAVQTRRPAPPRSEPAPTCCGPEDEDEETASLSANEAVSRWHTSDRRRVLKKSTVAGFASYSPQELLNVACERVRGDLNSRADPADQIERRLNGVAVNAEAVQAHEVEIRIEHSLRLAVG